MASTPPPPTTAPPASRPAAMPAVPSSAAPRPAVKRVIQKRQPKPICPKMIYNAVEGFGKTTLGAYAPNPFLLMARGEDGYDELLSSGRVPAVGAEQVDTWADVIGWAESLAADPQGIQTLVLDAMGGFERLCHEQVCTTEFNGNWGEKGFSAYQRGYDVAVPEWVKLLSALDRINDQGVVVVMLSHCRVRNFKNPMGADFDRYVADTHDKTWNVTAKWADVILFGNYRTIIEVSRSTGNIAKDKGKGIGGTDRVIYTERRDAFDAKNRYGLQPEITLPNDPAQTWNTVWGAISGQ